MKKDLKPCPFCGNTFLGCRMRVNPDEYLHKYEAFIFCHMCGAEGKKAKSEDEAPEEIQIAWAIDCWNDRDEDIEKIVEQVKAELYRKAKWELTEWKDEDGDGWGTQWAKCSLCGNATSSYHKAGAQDRFYDFCPKCGADMRGVE